MIFNLELTAEAEIQGRLVIINFTSDEDGIELGDVFIIGKNGATHQCNSRIIDRYDARIWRAINESWYYYNSRAGEGPWFLSDYSNRKRA